MGPHMALLERAVFFIFSRFLGFVFRAILIIIGLLFTFLVISTFPIFFFLPIKISKDYLQNLDSFGASLSYGDTYTLNTHSRDIVGLASERIYGKEKALRMIERGLSKDTNHNILLIGEVGVGRSTLIEHLGRLGQSGLSFPGIRHHRVVELFMEGLSLSDFDKCLAEAAKAGNVILVIKNIHNYESIYDRLMPYLHMPHLGIVVVTDFSSYDRVLKNYPEFLSKFEKVNIEETNHKDTVAILWNYVGLNKISIKEDALEEIVRLADRLIGNQTEPIKSISVLEELASLKKIINIDDVRQIISDKTNIPLRAMGADEKKILSEIEGLMREKIIGQDEAVKDVTEALRRLRTGISDHSKPAGSFLFLGSTGVGKTYTAKILAESYFGRKDAMIRFDMSEFSLSNSVDTFVERLGGVIEEMPLSLVFFDELEKSNRLIHNLFLQILDEGRLTRSSGREVSFKDAIIIATSNAGSANLVGDPNIDKKTLVDVLIKEGIFAPEFLNRFSNVVLFRPLGEKEVKNISLLMLRELASRLEQDNSIKLEITDALVEKISSAGFDPEFGARPIKRAIEEIVENKVAEYIIKGNSGGSIKIL